MLARVPLVASQALLCRAGSFIGLGNFAWAYDVWKGCWVTPKQMQGKFVEYDMRCCHMPEAQGTQRFRLMASGWSTSAIQMRVRCRSWASSSEEAAWRSSRIPLFSQAAVWTMVPMRSSTSSRTSGGPKWLGLSHAWAAVKMCATTNAPLHSRSCHYSVIQGTANIWLTIF